jgi:hypothetical protein
MAARCAHPSGVWLNRSRAEQQAERGGGSGVYTATRTPGELRGCRLVPTDVIVDHMGAGALAVHSEQAQRGSNRGAICRTRCMSRAQDPGWVATAPPQIGVVILVVGLGVRCNGKLHVV